MVPRATATHSWQLKIGGLGLRCSGKSSNSGSRTLEVKDQRKYRKFD